MRKLLHISELFMVLRAPLLLCIFLLGVIACGGSPLDNENYLERNGLGQSFVVTVSGLEGSLSVDLGGRLLVFTGNGSQSEGGYVSGDIAATIVSSPEDQDCFFFPSNLTEIVADATVTISCAVPGINGSVKNFFTGDAITDASITVYESVDGVSSLFASTTSDADGVYAVTDTVVDTRYVMSLSATGYAPQGVVTSTLSSRPSVIENILLVPENGVFTADPTANMTFVVEDVTVLEIPANGLVDADGAAAVGEITARITLLDPSAGNTVLPGRYELNTGGAIESYGGIAIVITDASGNALNLAEGVSADLHIPVATKSIASSPSTSNLYTYDDDSGYWVAGGSATLGTEGTVSIYSASLSSLSEVFTAGDGYEGIFIQGCIQDAIGNPVVGATVISQGDDYLGSGYGVSDSSGNFNVRARSESEVFVFALLGARSRTASVTTSTSNATISDCLLFDFSSVAITLTWGETPQDLDSHLYGPDPDTGGRFHIDWMNKSQEVGGQTIFLDVDDITSFGPEVTTIPNFPAAGTYEFLVHNFSEEPSIFDSPARVEINAQGENFAFSPPEGTVSLCWHVFNIVVDSTLFGVIEPVNTWLDADVCTSTGTLSATAVSQSAKVSPALRAIEQKYYAR